MRKETTKSLSKKGLKLVSFVLAMLFLVSCSSRITPEQAQNTAIEEVLVTSSTFEESDDSSSSVMEEINSRSRASSTRLAQHRTISRPAEVRGIWISFLEMKTMLENKTKAQFTKNIQLAFDNIKNLGLNTIYAQVRPYGDALYDSDFFPWSHTIAGVEGQDPGFDPLAIMVTEAHSRELLIEAWINPYRIRPDSTKNKPLSNTNQASKWIKSGDRSVVQYNNLISYHPASTKAQNLITNGVREIVENYEVDGVHIDDYFYPTTGTAFDKTFDKTEFDSYKKRGGTSTLANWRRQNVEKLIKKMYQAVKESNPNVYFGISPQSNIDTNYNAQYLDVAKIASNSGYCDYIAPQIYFGFHNKVQPYKQTLSKWEALVTHDEVELYIGLASYKVGMADKWAGDSGKNEWKNNTDLIARQVMSARTAQGYAGFILFRYDHIFKPAASVKAMPTKKKTIYWNYFINAGRAKRT